MQVWKQRWSAPEWRRYLDAPESAEEVGVLWQCTHTGRPLGTASFVAALEQLTSRSLAPQRGGRPRKQALPGQRELGFVA